MVQLRKVIGDVLRARRLAQHRTLREVSTAANVSLGYLSEIERGHKEASSELLAAICDALGAPLSELLSEVAATFALAEQVEAIGTAAAAATSTEQTAQAADQGSVRVTDGDVTVQVRSDGPLRTTLTATRTPGPRSAETVFVG
jgi:transcriptional regulator with XRE-family HTH domain